jgi:nucleoside-diphosphate-sugar epimerase
MRELRRREKHVRMVNRSGRVRFNKDLKTELGGIDAADPAQAREACEGAAVVYHCIGLPYARWLEFPSLASGILEGTAYAGAKLVYADNVYAYGPVNAPMTEDLPPQAGTKKGLIRASVAQALMRAHSAGKVRVAIGRGSDFFGPFATDAAIMGSRVFARALADKSAQLIGNPDRLHTYTFIDDFGKALVILGERDNALGKSWHVPNAAATTTRAFVEGVYAALGKRPRLRVAPRFAVVLLGRFDDNIRELREMLYQFERDFVVDSSRFEAAFGVQPTPLPDAVRQTLEWFRQHPA